MRKLKYQVSFAEEGLEKITSKYGFRVSKDLKGLKINRDSASKLEDELLTMFNTDRLGDIINQSDCRNYTIRKTRHKNPINNKGVSSGLRFITLLLLIEEDCYCTIFHIYSKTGSNQKNNLTQREINQCRELINHLIEKFEGA